MRLLIVSNRLPFTVSSENEDLTLHSSAGGLVSGLTAYLDRAMKTPSHMEYLWIGWPGIEVDEESRKKLKSKAAERQAWPVFIDAETMDKFYHGFCNSTIWPLFHYFSTMVKFDEADWTQYVKVNEIFRDAILNTIRPGDTIWIHDYQLMLLPKLLREKLPELPVGFFLHTP